MNQKETAHSHLLKGVVAVVEKTFSPTKNHATMLVQTLFSRNFKGSSNVSKVKTTVKILVSIYPGTKDYNEKKTLLSEINSLCGLATHQITKQIITSDDSSISMNNMERTVMSPESDISYDLTSAASLNGKTESNILDVTPMFKMPSPLKLIAKAVKPSSSKKRKAEINKLMEHIKLFNTLFFIHPLQHLL
jgi:hypothetical protein